MSERTIVHLLRHGEVYNPDKILYGRLPGYRLSELGLRMADRARDYFVGDRQTGQPPAHAPMHDIVRIVSSPMERAQQTAAPLAGKLGLDVDIDERIIEAGNRFEGKPVAGGQAVLRQPRSWRHLYDPFTPSWGEPYAQIAFRMHSALEAARDGARGHETVLVSHQLPIWIARLSAEHRRLWHDPRRRQCALASVTSFHYEGDELTSISYAEPSADLLKGASSVAGA